MQARAIIILIIAVLLGGAAVWLINTQLQQPAPQVTEKTGVETRPVVVVTEDLPAGEELQRITLKAVAWPADSVPEGAYSEVDTLMGEETVPTLVKEIRKGEPVLPYKLAGKGQKMGLTTKIPKGKRAVTIAVNEVRGVAGFVLPGNRVDILHTTTAGRRADDTVTRLIEQNLLVLGVDQEASEDENEPMVVNAVTLLVTPQQAQRLTLAESVGQLNLVLRNEADDTTPHPDVVATYNLTTPPLHPPKKVVSGPGVQKTKAKPKPKGPAKREVELIRGLAVEEETVTELPESETEKSGQETGDRKAE